MPMPNPLVSLNDDGVCLCQHSGMNAEHLAASAEIQPPCVPVPCDPLAILDALGAQSGSHDGRFGGRHPVATSGQSVDCLGRDRQPTVLQIVEF